jgi:hypothetical protein
VRFRSPVAFQSSRDNQSKGVVDHEESSYPVLGARQFPDDFEGRVIRSGPKSQLNLTRLPDGREPTRSSAFVRDWSA